MYAFGDSKQPNPASGELLEEYIMDFMEDILLKSYQRAVRRDPTTNKLLKDDLIYFLKDDSKILTRVTYMLNYEKAFADTKKDLKEDQKLNKA